MTPRQARRRDRARPSPRRRSLREPKKRLLVVCLGTTEERYVKALARHHRDALVHVEVASTTRSPTHVIKKATSLRDEAVAAGRRHRDPYLRFDEVWCVFDCDDFASFEEACGAASSAGHHLAASNPCIEYWFLLHFAATTASLNQHEALTRLKKHWPGYAKVGPSLGNLSPHVEQAEVRAERLTAAAEAAGEPHRRPTTSMFRLVRRLRGAS